MKRNRLLRAFAVVAIPLIMPLTSGCEWFRENIKPEPKEIVTSFNLTGREAEAVQIGETRHARLYNLQEPVNVEINSQYSDNYAKYEHPSGVITINKEDTILVISQDNYVDRDADYSAVKIFDGSRIMTLNKDDVVLIMGADGEFIARGILDDDEKLPFIRHYDGIIFGFNQREKQYVELGLGG